MKTVIGNWENDNVTTITVSEDRISCFISARQLKNALTRMGTSSSAKLRFVPVAGANLDINEVAFEIRA